MPSAFPVRVAVITTWGEKCGIAEYSQSLLTQAAQSVPGLEFTVLAASGMRAIEPHQLPMAVPSWSKGSQDVTRIVEVLHRLQPAVVHVQFQYGFFPVQALGAILNAAHGIGAKTIVQFHKVVDPEGRESIATVAKELLRASRLYVHNSDDRRALSEMGLSERAIRLVAIGQSSQPAEERLSARIGIGLEGFPHIVASFGFLLPHKGILELISALPQMLREHPEMLLVLPCALYPSDSSIRYLRNCRLRASSLGVESRVLFITEFLPLPLVMRILHASDTIVLPYLATGESASAAIRMALSAGRPVIATDQSAFDEVRGSLMTIDGVDSVTIANAVSTVLDEPELYESLAAMALSSAESACWPTVGRVYGLDLLDVAGVHSAHSCELLGGDG